MADFGENFCGNRAQVPCPFGCESRDTQQHAYDQCQAIHSKVHIHGKYKDIFENHISASVATSVSQIIKARMSLLDERDLQYSPFGGNVRRNMSIN